MKFAEHLGAHITPEWRKQYVQYKVLRSMLDRAVEDAPPAAAETVTAVEEADEERKRHLAKFDERFFTVCEKELAKINTFYSEKLSEATRKFSALRAELSLTVGSSNNNNNNNNRSSTSSIEEMLNSGIMGITGKMGLLQNKRPTIRKVHDLKLAFSENYLSLVLLQNYQNLNYTAFCKILKKRDKLFNDNLGSNWLSSFVDVAPFHRRKDLDQLISQVESTFAEGLEGGDRHRAMKRLRVPPLGARLQSAWTTFRVGWFSGAFSVLVVIVMLSALLRDFSAIEEKGSWRVIFRLFRGPLLLVFFVFLMGINVYGWRTAGVNHVLIFELDPRHHLSEQHLLELSSFLGLIWTFFAIAFLHSDHIGIIPAFAFPLILNLTLAAFLLNPTETFRKGARFWLLRILGRISVAPLLAVGFADFWLADQLNSLVSAFADLHFTVCFYTTSNSTLNDGWNVALDSSPCLDSSSWHRTLVMCLPAWFRFAQCLRRYRDSKEAFPHLANAGKYFSAISVFLSSHLSDSYPDPGLLFHFWVFCCVISSVYTYAWDVKMDWSLLHMEHGLLREELIYSSKGFYYAAVVEDLLLRFRWLVSLVLVRSTGWHKDGVNAIMSPLEVFRRFVWNFFRLENEHLNNIGKYRAVRDISVAPVNSSDQDIIVRMMDDENGVWAVRRRHRMAHMGKKKKRAEEQPNLNIRRNGAVAQQRS